MSTISIILPVYNAEKYLDKCLTALINQTFSDIEILCINDGSSDNSLYILEKFAHTDNRIKIFTIPNSGPATARNIGLQNSTGKYLMFCDSDDWYAPTSCEEMLAIMENENVDIAVCATNLVKESKNARQEDLAYYQLPLSGKKYIHTFDDIHEINAVLWSKIFKKSIIDQFNIHFPDKHIHDDDAFVFLYTIHCKSIYYHNKQLYNYLIRNFNSSMSQFNTAINSFARIHMLHAVYKQLEQNNLIDQYKDYYASFYDHNFGITLLMARYDTLIAFLEKEQRFIREKDLNFVTTISNIDILKKDIQTFIEYKKLPLSRNELIQKRDKLKKKLAFKQLLNIITLNSIRGFKNSIKDLKFKINIANKKLQYEE